MADGRPRRDPAGFEAKKREILRAASRAFARKGFAGTRVGDIAKEAGIAYGLIYHYFENKDAILRSIFQGMWGVSLKVIEDIAGRDGSLEDKLRSIAGFFLEAWRLEPDSVEVVLKEVLRSPKFLDAENVEAFRGLFERLEGMFRAHADELRDGVDPRLTAVLFLGALEILLTGMIARELLGADAAAIEQSRDALVDTFLHGIAG